MLSQIGIKVDSIEILQAQNSIDNLIAEIEKIAKRKSQPLRDFRSTTARKLKNLVFSLSVNISDNFYTNTRIGDSERIKRGLEAGASKSDRRYARMYEVRRDRYGLDMEAGYHAGAYSYSESQIASLRPEIKEYNKMVSDLTTSFKNQYSLGDEFYIGAEGPAYQFMEDSSQINAPILQPTVESIMATYAHDLLAAYEKG